MGNGGRRRGRRCRRGRRSGRRGDERSAAGLIKAGHGSVENGLAGDGGSGNRIDALDSIGGEDSPGELLDGRIGNALGLLGSVDRDGSDEAVLDCEGDGDRAHPRGIAGVDAILISQGA